MSKTEYVTSRDCRECGQSANVAIKINATTIETKCKKCDRKATLPRIPTVVREPFGDD